MKKPCLILLTVFLIVTNVTEWPKYWGGLTVSQNASYAIWPHLFQEAGLPDLLGCWEPYTKINIQECLAPWINPNAQVSLAVEKAKMLAKSVQYETEVTIHVDSDQDYEILTSLEYKIEKDGQAIMLPLRFVKKGIQTVRFVSDKAPLYVKLDPDCRVPRMTDDRLTWERGT